MISLSFQSSCLLVRIRGVCSAVWFGFKDKSHPNYKIKKHAVFLKEKNMRFCLVQLTLKIKSEPNQTNVVWIGWCSFFFKTIQFFVSNIKIKLKKVWTQHIFNNVLNFIEHYNFILILQCFQQHRPNKKRGQKVILFYKKCKKLRFYHSLKV